MDGWKDGREVEHAAGLFEAGEGWGKGGRNASFKNMRPSDTIDLKNPDYEYLYRFDQRDIDNSSEPYNFFRLNYLHYLQMVISSTKKYIPPGGLILEIGCAQANSCLLLAESGYRCVALDLKENFLKYSQEKYEFGKMWWFCGDGFALPFKPRQFDAVLLLEFLEHVAYPEELLNQLTEYLKPGGVAIATTPNGDCFNNRLPNLTALGKERQTLVQKQFGPGGEDHLFHLTRREFEQIFSQAGFDILRFRYIKTLFLNSHTYRFYKRLPLAFITLIQKLTEKTPYIKGKFSMGMFVVACYR